MANCWVAKGQHPTKGFLTQSDCEPVFWDSYVAVLRNLPISRSWSIQTRVEDRGRVTLGVRSPGTETCIRTCTKGTCVITCGLFEQFPHLDEKHWQFWHQRIFWKFSQHRTKNRPGECQNRQFFFFFLKGRIYLYCLGSFSDFTISDIFAIAFVLKLRRIPSVAAKLRLDNLKITQTAVRQRWSDESVLLPPLFLVRVYPRYSFWVPHDNDLKRPGPCTCCSKAPIIAHTAPWNCLQEPTKNVHSSICAQMRT